MRKIFLVLLLLTSVVTAMDNRFFMGMRNQRFLFAGVQHGAYGIAFEQSLLNQDFELQHGRIALFAKYSLPFTITLWYILYGGMQYDLDYYDYGGELSLLWAHHRYVQIKARYRPFYDSDLGVKYGFLFQMQSYPFKEVGFYAGVKNMPDYRNVERRFFGGMLFDVGRLGVYPEISVPVHGSLEWIRVQLNFIYNYDFK